MNEKIPLWHFAYTYCMYQSLIECILITSNILYIYIFNKFKSDNNVTHAMPIHVVCVYRSEAHSLTTRNLCTQTCTLCTCW